MDREVDWTWAALSRRISRQFSPAQYQQVQGSSRAQPIQLLTQFGQEVSVASRKVWSQA